MANINGFNSFQNERGAGGGGGGGNGMFGGLETTGLPLVGYR